jgi:hypothetical protein
MSNLTLGAACTYGVRRALLLWICFVVGYALTTGLLHAMLTWLPAMFPQGTVLSLP